MVLFVMEYICQVYHASCKRRHVPIPVFSDMLENSGTTIKLFATFCVADLKGLSYEIDFENVE